MDGLLGVYMEVMTSMPVDIPGDKRPRPARWAVFAAIRRGLKNLCPACGEGRLLEGYLMPHAACPACDASNGEIMAQDAPPYITILIVGHVIVPLIVLWERSAAPPILVHYSVWLPAILLLTYILLRRVKGAWMGFMWALGLKGTEHQ